LTDTPTAASRVAQVERRLIELQEAAQFSDLRDRLENVDTRLGQLPAALAGLRSQGYVFHSSLEERIAGLRRSWPGTRRQVQEAIAQRATDLEPDVREAIAAVQRLQSFRVRPLATAEPSIAAVEARLESLAQRVRAAAATVAGMFDALERELRAIDGEISTVAALLAEMRAASFPFQPDECGVAMVQAEQMGAQKDDTLKGILFLTDRRLIMERAEKVATKKVLFITTKSELVRELLWEVSIDLLEGAQATEERKALIFTHDFLTLTFKSPAAVQEVTLRLKDDSEEWRGLIDEVKSGRIEGQRVAGSPAGAQATRYIVPAKCPGCGAGLSLAGEVRGMSAYTCETCGNVIALSRAE
jgi:predicted RNA-binding Zn-ribbon protein involved in translation (DUF1610 family)